MTWCGSWGGAGGWWTRHCSAAFSSSCLTPLFSPQQHPPQSQISQFNLIRREMNVRSKNLIIPTSQSSIVFCTIFRLALLWEVGGERREEGGGTEMWRGLQSFRLESVESVETVVAVSWPPPCLVCPAPSPHSPTINIPPAAVRPSLELISPGMILTRKPRNNYN